MITYCSTRYLYFPFMINKKWAVVGLFLELNNIGICFHNTKNALFKQRVFISSSFALKTLHDEISGDPRSLAKFKFTGDLFRLGYKSL